MIFNDLINIGGFYLDGIILFLINRITQVPELDIKLPAIGEIFHAIHYRHAPVNDQ